MIPTTSLSEVFERHKKLMYEKIGACSCGHMKNECDCKPDCKCGCNKKVEECATCGCGDPSDTHGIPKEEEEEEEKKELNESYAPPFSRMRGLAGLGKIVLASNGNWTDTTVKENIHPPGASHPFNTNWKMDKERAGYVKMDEAKLNQIKSQLDKKSKRGTLSDKEFLLAKRLNEVLKKRSALDKQSQAVDKRFAKMEKDPTDCPFPFDKDHTGPMRHANEKGQLPVR